MSVTLPKWLTKALATPFEHTEGCAARFRNGAIHDECCSCDARDRAVVAAVLQGLADEMATGYTLTANDLTPVQRAEYFGANAACTEWAEQLDAWAAQLRQG